MNKKIILAFIIGLIVSGTIAYALTASEIKYKETNVDAALNELNTKVNNGASYNKVCKLISGTMGTIGSKYECDPGDGEKRNFFLLANNPGEVELIMEHNITEGSSKTTMTWNDAMKYFRTGDGSVYKTSWKNVMDINLPSAQTIANAVGNNGWNMEDKDYKEWFYFDKNSSGSYGQTGVANSSNLSNYKWLFNYTRECTNYGCDADTSLGGAEAYGYWTRDVVAKQLDSTGRAWGVICSGTLNFIVLTNGAGYGVRPVITLLKSNLYE